MGNSCRLRACDLTLEAGMMSCSLRCLPLKSAKVGVTPNPAGMLLLLCIQPAGNSDAAMHYEDAQHKRPADAGALSVCKNMVYDIASATIQQRRAALHQSAHA